MINKIEVIHQRFTIYDIIERCGLQRPDKNNKIRSIYNQDEKTPSMHIYGDTNSFTDFSSGTSGDMIDLFKDYHQIDIKTAINELYDYAGGEASISNGIQKQRSSTRKVKLIKKARSFKDIDTYVYEYDPADKRQTNDYIEKILTPHKELQKIVFAELFNQCGGCNDNGLNYLSGEQRNFTYANIWIHKLFTIKENTKEFLLSRFTFEELLNSGLFNEDGYFIFSNHRLVIPYLENNEIVYLRGRYLDANGNSKPTGETSKYISLNNKYAQNLLLKRWYNLDCLKLQQVDNEKDIYIFEGEFDTMIGQQKNGYSIGFPGVSNFPYSDIDVLKDYNIFICTDNDAPGDKIALEIAIAVKEKLNKSVKRIRFQGKDISESYKGLE
jgi:DNA primase